MAEQQHATQQSEAARACGATACNAGGVNVPLIVSGPFVENRISPT